MSSVDTYDIIMLENSSSVEVMNESLPLVVAIHLLDLVDKGTRLSIAVANRTEAVPQRDEDDLRLGPDLADTGDEGDVAAEILLAAHAIIRIIIVRPKIDNGDVGSSMLLEVPRLRMLAVEFSRPARGVARLEPLVGLASGVPPAVCIDQADARVRGDGELDIAEPSTDAPSIRRQALVGIVHP